MKRKTTKKAVSHGTKVPTKGPRKTWPSSAPGQRGFGDPINSKSLAAREMEAAKAIARAWLAKAGFHEDAYGDAPDRIEIGLSDVGSEGERYVNVRLYIPQLDIDHVVDDTHPQGITTKKDAA